MKSYQLLGLMSGTSLDGLDVVNVQFTQNEKGVVAFNLLGFQTFNYTKELTEKIKSAMDISSINLFLLDKEIGNFYADCVNDFIIKNKIVIFY